VVLWRFGARWYLIAVFVPITMALLTGGIAVLTGRGALEFIPVSQLLGLLVVDIFTGATGEELGWRGTALPRLQARWSPLVSSLVLGILWGLYHLPSFLLSGLPLQDVPLIPFMMAALGLTILVTWTFNRTGGSLIPVFLYHFAFNFTGGATGIFASPSLIWLLAIICCAAAMAVVALDWARFTRPAEAPGKFVSQSAGN
jgi:membrane protease YdiL (CAAX protease family)